MAAAATATVAATATDAAAAAAATVAARGIAAVVALAAAAVAAVPPRASVLLPLPPSRPPPWALLSLLLQPQALALPRLLYQPPPLPSSLSPPRSRSSQLPLPPPRPLWLSLPLRLSVAPPRPLSLPRPRRLPLPPPQPLARPSPGWPSSHLFFPATGASSFTTLLSASLSPYCLRMCTCCRWCRFDSRDSYLACLDAVSSPSWLELARGGVCFPGVRARGRHSLPTSTHRCVDLRRLDVSPPPLCASSVRRCRQ